MTRITQHGISLVAIVFFFSCKPTNVTFSKLRTPSNNGLHLDYLEYCNTDFSQKFGDNAVLSSLIGNHELAIQQASKISSVSKKTDFEVNQNVILELKELLKANNLSSDRKTEIEQYLNFIERSTNIHSAFAGYELEKATDFILSKADDYHYLLINEAHYSGQHRAFTTELLQPLWDKGYTYLALEALSSNDTVINERGYPTTDSGYYIRESTFGNMIRKAKKIGYKLVAYETKLNNDGTSRDTEQANNLYNQTLRKDDKGKVLVHAGYGHISEVGDEKYKPMAYQLKILIGEDILTVDQQTMTEMADRSKESSYYSFAMQHFKIEEASVFINKDNKCLIDPVNSTGIDIQVYHPKTFYINSRPNWLKNNSNDFLLLPKEYVKYNGCLVQIKKMYENRDAIPVDSFILDKHTASIIVNKGNFYVEIYDCEGKLIAEGNLIFKN